jgi:hypothetical protein
VKIQRRRSGRERDRRLAVPLKSAAKSRFADLSN